MSSLFRLYSIIFALSLFHFHGYTQTTLSLNECKIVMKGNAKLSVEGDVLINEVTRRAGFLSLEKSNLYISGNLTANGSAGVFLDQDFTHLYLIGKQQQLLSQTHPSDINIESLSINNPSGIKTLSNLTVSDTIHMLEGNLDLDGYRLSMRLNTDYASSRAFGDAHPHPWIESESDKSYIFGGVVSTEGNILASLISAGYDFANLGMSVSQSGLRSIHLERGHTSQQIGEGESLRRYFNISTTSPINNSGDLRFRFLNGDIPEYTNALGLQFFRHEIQANGDLLVGANWIDAGISSLDIQSKSALLENTNTIYPMRWTLYECNNPKLLLTVEKFVACTGDSIRLSVQTEPGMEIEWSTGQNIQEIYMTSDIGGPMNVGVKVTAPDGCFSVDTVQLNFTAAPSVTFEHHVIESCIGTIETLHPVYSGEHINYLWSTGDTTAAIDFEVKETNETRLSVVVSVDGECFDSDSIIVNGLEGPVVDLGPDTTECQHNSIILDPGVTQQATYLWWPGQQTSPTLSVSNSGTYSVVVTNSQTQCSDADTVTVALSKLFVTRSVDNPSCPGESDGRITLNIESGTKPYDIVWNTGDTGRVLHGLPAGKYSVTITDAVGCTKVFPTISVRDPKQLKVKYDLVPDLCRDGEGSITLHPSGGHAPYDFSWRSNQNDAEYTSKDLSALYPGAYFLTMIDASNCILIDTVWIDGPHEDLTVQFNTTNIQCEDNREGRIEISQVSGGTSPYTYMWSTGETSEDIDSLSPGEYVVTITDENGCSLVSDIIPIIISDSLLVHFKRTFPSCEGAEDGSLEVVTYGAAQPLEILWSTGANDLKIENIPSGEYSVTVTDATGCVGYQSGILAGPQLLGMQVDSIVHVECFHSDEGSVFLTAFGADGNYTYDWSHDGPDSIDNDTEDLTDLVAGSYTLTITSSNNCVLQQTFEVEGGDSIHVSLERVFGACDNSIRDGVGAIVSGGEPTYQYRWSNGDTTAMLTSVPFGKYDLTVTDELGCFAIGSYELDPIDELTANLTVDLPRCAGDTSTIKLEVIGGIPPYTFDWSDGINNIEQLAWVQAGSYDVNITDGRGCEVQHSFVLPTLSRLNVERQVFPLSSSSASDGAIFVNTSGGVPPYSFNWDNGSNLDSITNLSAGTYTLTVTDGQGCQTIQSTQIDVRSAFVIDAEVRSPSCFDIPDGRISIQIQNDHSPLSLLWSNGSTKLVNENLVEGNYQLTITDAIDRDTVVTFQLSSEFGSRYTIETKDETCSNSNDGEIKIEAFNDAPFDAIIAGQNYPNQIAELTINNLSPGVYPIQLTNVNQCMVKDTVNVEAAETILVQSEVLYAVEGAGGNGRIRLQTSNNLSAYTFHWSNGRAGRELDGLQSGNYVVTISDENSCTIVESIDVPLYPALFAESIQQHNYCGDIEQGEIDLVVTGGIPPYSFFWSNGDTTEDVSGIAGGQYTVRIEDTGGRSVSKTSDIYTFDEIDIDVTKSDIQCSGTASGKAEIEVFGGIQPYTIQWSTGHDGLAITNLVAGKYTVTVTDDNGCSITDQIDIVDHPPLALNKDVIGLSMTGASDGQISVTVDGGLPPYTTIWSTGIVDTVISNLSEGWYEILVVDQTGCAISDSTFISLGFGGSEPLVLQLSATDVSCYGFMDGAVDLTVEGGESPYDFNWSNGASTEDINGLDGGSYSVTVTDAADSSIVGVVEVVEPEELKIELEVVPLSCDGSSPGSISANVFGGVEPYEYEWNTGDVEMQITIDRADDYDVYVTDANDCDADADTTIVEPTAMDVSITSTNIGCGGAETGSAIVNIEGGVTPYDITWSNGEQDESIENLSAGIYDVTVVDANGCTVIASTTIEMSEGSVMARFLAASPVQAGDTVQFIDLSYPIPENWTWHFDDPRGSTSTSSDPQFIYENDPSLDESHYDVTLIVENDGCIDSLTKTIRVINTRSGQSGPDPQLLPMVTRISYFEIFPNPTKDMTVIAVGLNQVSDIMLEVYSTDGRKIMSENVKGVQVNKMELDIRHLAAGMYLVRLTADHDSRTLRLIKSN